MIQKILITVGFCIAILCVVFWAMFRMNSFGENPSLSSIFTYQNFFIAVFVFIMSFVLVNNYDGKDNDDE